MNSVLFIYMGKKIALFVLVVLVGGGALAFMQYRNSMQRAALTPTAPRATPDNTVIAGPVTAITATSISVAKQDGTTATLGITATTRVTAAAVGGQAGIPKKVSDIKKGAVVLVTSGSDSTVAASIVLLPAPPVQ